MRLDYWNEFLTQSLQHFCGSSIDIMNVLKLSYYHLPPELQTCFRYCSLFPQDYSFEKNQIVEMWVNSGLISHDESQTSLVSIGEEYLIQLTRKSFFDLRFNVDRLGQVYKECGYYVMHDLMHDLATNISFGECVRIVDVSSFQNVLRTVRRIRVEYIYNFHVEKIRKISCLEHLRTIMIDVGNNNEGANIDILNAVEQLVARSKSLRLLDTQLWHTSHFASTLAKLKHLRCIILQNTHSYQESMYGNYHIRRIKGYNISVLKDLGSLRSLSVKGLENVDNQEEAKEANMKSKKYLESLQILNCQKLTETRLSLASEVSDCHEESRRFLQIQTISIDQPSLLFVEPLKSLCPTDRLDIGDGSETLDVIGPWLLKNCTSLQDLSIFEANLESLTPTIRELSSLKCLRLYGSGQICSLSNLPSSLDSLYVSGCHPELQMEASTRGSLEWSKISHIPQVQIGDESHRQNSVLEQSMLSSRKPIGNGFLRRNGVWELP
ncbi:hypothetical protein U9M48_005321 [Paspalum notatum var. saurae]|uniref:Uncharacterized protein n=1 Tax=Paspalum notatum var. saurae TaxID=547442 RepID=A0AAQ3SLD0_PASNO